MGLSFLLFYTILGVAFLLSDIARVAKQDGVTFREQMEVSLMAADNRLRWVLFGFLLWVAAWPILLVIAAGGPPTRGAT